VNAPERWFDDLPKKAAKELFKNEEWGCCYSYTTRTYVDDSCDVLERAKEWEEWTETDYVEYLKGEADAK
jgi:hypothetical protein